MHSRGKFFGFISALFLFLPFLSASLHAGESQKSERIRIGYSSISGSRIGLWVAQDKRQIQ